jgi:hypothetical protein
MYYVKFVTDVAARIWNSPAIYRRYPSMYGNFRVLKRLAIVFRALNVMEAIPQHT